MSLTSGTRLGPYEIQAPIGAGGMGEVYRARDTRLERTVAVKVLPSHLSASAEVRQRFEREAKTISSLSHPHICALYDVGNQDGVEYLVMEYLEGDTLSERLTRGPLPFDQVLRYGCEIADALDKAHRQGIVHRDLKPGNVMLTKSGVKLLDFGLAKAVAPAAARSGVSLTALPTEQVRTELTAEGTILGTLQYMAPEQLEGRDADARTDIFAFGAVLYEMATGQKAFAGRSQASLVSSIMTAEPAAVSTVAATAPPAFDRVVRTCLAKDPDDRWQTAHDIAVQLKWIQEGGSQIALPTPIAGRRRSLRWLPWALAAALAVALAASFIRRPQVQPVPRAIRFSVTAPENTEFLTGPHIGSLALSPDGTSLAFIAVTGGKNSLWVRRLDSLEAKELPNTKGAISPFWSPDGRFLGFFARGKLQKIAVAGGPPQALCESAFGNAATWGPGGTILFTEFAAGREGIYEVSAEGGSPAQVTPLDRTRGERSLGWPVFLPDGRHFLFLSGAFGGEKSRNLWVGSLDSKETHRIMAVESLVEYCPPGYLLHVRGGTLLSQPFDAESLRVTGDPIPISDDVWFFRGTGNAGVSTSENGSVAYLGGRRPSRLTWRDRSGREIGAVGAAAVFRNPRISPDGSSIAIEVGDPRIGTRDIWIYDGQGLGQRFTADPVDAVSPVWSPGGDRIAFGSARETPVDVYVKSVKGTGSEQLLLKGRGVQLPSDWSPDGSRIVYEDFSPARSAERQLWVLPIAGDRKPFPLLRTPFNAAQARYSPGGEWIAYISEESGRPEVYVVSTAGEGETRRISPSGGTRPRWGRDGKELFYLAANGDLISVPTRIAGGFAAGPPSALFNAKPPPVDFDVSPDGRRFLFEEAALADVPLTLVVDWAAEARK